MTIRTLAFIVGIAVTPVAAVAQAPSNGTRTLAAFADSIAAAGDTARAVAMLDSAVRADRNDAASWHQLGVLLWNQAKGQRRDGLVQNPRVIRLLAGADSSLRLATQLAPDSARFWISLNQFNTASNLSTTMFAAGGNADKALEAAERVGDSMSVGIAADAAGMAAWRRYEPIAKRAIASDGRPIDLGMLSNARRDVAVDYINSFIRRIEPPTGTADYERALTNFRRALAVEPTNQKFARHVYMALGERENWSELLALATQRAGMYPFDYQAQLARGLAAHRLNMDKDAQRAFDSALVLMDEKQRDRMTSLTRILRPTQRGPVAPQRSGGIGDSAAYMNLSEQQRNAVSALYWLMADPLAITPENEHRNEFMARITWADFRWSDEDRDMLGADTDRGDIFVRYGPPEIEMTVPGSSTGNQGAGITLAWVYPGQMAFFFDMMPGFLTAHTAFYDKDFVEQVRNAAPVSFANVPATRMLDTIPVMMTRFRARTADSMDVVVAASIPVDSMVRGVPMTSAPIDVNVRVFDQFAMTRGVENTQTIVATDTVRRPLRQSWVRRVGPGLNLVRIEALQADTRRAARAVARVDFEAGRGYGMSDILLGSTPTPRGGAAPQRWTDIDIAPNTGVFAGSRIGLVWEIYEPFIREEQAKYRIDITVERVSRGFGGFTARVLDGLGRTLGREQRGTDRLSIAFDRVAPPANTLVEYMTLDMGEGSFGEFRLTITIIDQNSRRTTSKSTTFFIR